MLPPILHVLESGITSIIVVYLQSRQDPQNASLAPIIALILGIGFVERVTVKMADKV
jgi:hypothetical protein